MSAATPRLPAARLALAGLGVLVGCGIVPHPAQRTARMPRIGVLSQTTGGDATAAALRRGLADLGYVEGQSVAIEWRHADGRSDRFPTFATELVGLDLDVVVAEGASPTRAAKEATATVPIVMAFASDPARTGLIASLARPGGNVTGLATIVAVLVGKRLELLKEALPGISRLGVLRSPGNPDRDREFLETEAAAQTLSLQVQSLEVRSPDDLGGALASVTGGNAEALFTQDTGVLDIVRPRILDHAAKARLPVVSIRREFVELGGLMCYGPEFPDMCWRAAAFVDKVLKGAKPADLPVEQPTKFDFVVNLKAAQTIGLIIPQSVLLQATEIIQ